MRGDEATSAGEPIVAEPAAPLPSAGAGGTGGLLEMHVDPRRVVRLCGVAIAMLCAAHLLMQWFRLNTGHEYVFGFVRLFNLDGEGNAPAWFSSLLLIACAAVLWIITAGVRRRRQPFVAHWGALAAGFTFMSLDETAGIHDAVVGQAIEDRFHPPGYALYFAVPGAVITFAVLLAYLLFLRHLPHRFRVLFVVAGMLYVGGAVGMESVGGAVGGTYGWNSWALHLCVFAEETLEMVGVALFLYALLEYVGEAMPQAALRVMRRGL